MKKQIVAKTLRSVGIVSLFITTTQFTFAAPIFAEESLPVTIAGSKQDKQLEKDRDAQLREAMESPDQAKQNLEIRKREYGGQLPSDLADDSEPEWVQDAADSEVLTD